MNTESHNFQEQRPAGTSTQIGKTSTVANELPEALLKTPEGASHRDPPQCCEISIKKGRESENE